MSTTASAERMRSGAFITKPGSSSMPTETKNSTANASRIGNASDAARTLNSDRPTTRPARNAPSAIDTPKNCAEATEMPSARARTVSVKSSRERVAAIRVSSQGTTRLPPTRMRAVSTRDLDHRERQRHASGSSSPAPRAKIAGIITSTSTVSRSSTTSHPTAMWPARRMQVAIVRQDADEHDRARDREPDAKHQAGSATSSQRHGRRAMPRPVATALCAIAPGTATRQTATSSSMWNCMPTPNISRMMPTSASCSAMWRSATKPGV